MTKHGGPEVLHFAELPDPKPGPGEVLLKVDAAAVDFSGLMRRCGDVYPVPTPLPFVPRAEVVSTVAPPATVSTLAALVRLRILCRWPTPAKPVGSWRPQGSPARRG